jgi:hypothetical protein
VTVQSAWSAPVTLSDPGQDASRPQVAVDQSGNAVFVWKRFDGSSGSCCDRIEARTRSATGTLGAVQTLSDAGQNADVPQVAVDPNGNAVFTWTRSDGLNTRIEARTRSSTGTLSAVEVLSAAAQNATAPQVGIDSSANAVFAWTLSDGLNTRIEARARSAAGVLSATQILSPVGRDASSPALAVDQSGNAVAVWERFGGGTSCGGSACSLIEARVRSAAGALSPVQMVSPFGQHAHSPQVAVDQGGNAIFTWERSDGTNTRVQARARSTAGALSAVQTLSAAGQDALRPQVAVDQGGNAIFAWERSDGTNPRIEARARSAAAALSPVQILSAAGQPAGIPQVAVDSTGKAVFVWRRFGGTNNRIQARARSAAGVLGAVETLSAGGQPADLPQVAVDQSGHAVAVWKRSDGVDELIQAATSP